MVHSVLKTDGNPSEAIHSLLRRLLDEGIVDALLVPLRVASGDNTVQTLVRDPRHLEGMDVLAPVMPVTTARLVSAITMTGIKERVGVVMRDCEIRAVVELVKLQQAQADNLLIIGMDCLGTYEVPDYADLMRSGADVEGELLAHAIGGQPHPHEGKAFRTACQMCEKFTPSHGDLRIHLFGDDPRERIHVEVADDLAAKLGLEPAAPAQARENVVAAIARQRTETRDRLFASFRERTKDIAGLQAYLSTCIRCHNCMVNCPICYCKECIFRTPIFDHESEKYQMWAARKGAVRLPTDTLLFHITRLNHMVTSCVGCGMCDSACPSHLPIATMFRAVGQEVQALFDYVPGRSLDEPPPVATFREDELEGIQ
ncbi:MAG: Coenzyme F420 hydrogenase/dehydrogenase, beta subunit C-terminal domain [Anaerolineales bacterium]